MVYYKMIMNLSMDVCWKYFHLCSKIRFNILISRGTIGNAIRNGYDEILLFELGMVNFFNEF